ncbi:hypothetical protein M7I_0306 [Glarea lozoyensis 74030]|uniref:BRCT domain-containing protein n=1 Tax=Glarea lozoyensis (strain ATCC 74030 / MF5533) TaxID=1104152 RepID=H0ED07_GLAL7|nr:hypothetical protein M7I_0306 [Glarea lozoyensis 74030]
MTKDCSVLISKSQTGLRKDKYEYAKDWKIPILAADWLWECISQGVRVEPKAHTFRSQKRLDALPTITAPPKTKPEEEKERSPPTQNHLALKIEVERQPSPVADTSVVTAPNQAAKIKQEQETHSAPKEIQASDATSEDASFKLDPLSERDPISPSRTVSTAPAPSGHPHSKSIHEDYSSGISDLLAKTRRQNPNGTYLEMSSRNFTSSSTNDKAHQLIRRGTATARDVIIGVEKTTSKLVSRSPAIMRYFVPLLSSTGNVSTDLIQAGLMIAVYEHSQAMHRDAWLTVGTCARMGHLLGLHTLIKQVSPPEGSQRAGFEEKRRLWWIIVVLERIVSHDSKDTRLPFASEPPHAHDILPPRSLEVETPPIVISDMLLPEHINLEDRGAIPSRQFTGLGPFPTTIQAVYLSTLIDEHIKTTFSNPELRKLNARKLHACLESFSGACIPGPGKSEGTYCGSYSIRTFSNHISAVFALYEHELALAVQEGDLDSISQITTSSLALANLVIYLTGSTEDKPIDMPTLSYWSHRITYLACMTFIKYAPRDGDWEGKIEVCRRYLGQLTPRFRIYIGLKADL